MLRFKVNAVSALRCDLLRDVKIYARIYVKYKSSTGIKTVYIYEITCLLQLLAIS